MKDSIINKNDLLADKSITLCLCALMSYSSIAFFINLLFNFFVSPGFIWDTAILMGLIIIIISFSIRFIWKRITIDMIVLPIMLSLIVLISFFMNPLKVNYLIDIFFRLMFYAFPGYLWARSIRNYNIFHRYMKVNAIIIVSISIATYLLSIITDTIDLQYMVFSYNMLPGVIYILYLYIKTSKKRYLVLSIINIMIIFLGGARGPLFCIIGFVILFYFVNFHKYYKRIVVFSFGVLTSVFFYDKYHIILIGNISKLLSSYGIKSRTLDLIIQESFMDSSGRENYYSQIFQAIKQNPIKGLGVGGDGFLLQSIFNTTGTEYSHNLILEILAQYGVVFGSGIIIILMTILVFSLVKKGNNLQVDLICIFLPLGIIKLLGTGSYLYEPFFFILFGFAINVILVSSKGTKQLIGISENNKGLININLK